MLLFVPFFSPCLLGGGGDDEFQGLVDYTFTRPDGTQLGTQGTSFYFVSSSCNHIYHPLSSLRVVAGL